MVEMMLYAPLNTLKLIAPNIWIVDGPVVNMTGPVGLCVPLLEPVSRMRAWHSQQIILAHGLCYLRDADTELRRAFRWLN